MSKELTFKQKKFVGFYNGNATRAAIAAGYSNKTAYSIGQELLKKPEILREIQTRNKGADMASIATRQQRQEFWSSVMEDPETELQFRLKASELLGKSEADFTDKIQAGPPTNLAEMIREARERVNAGLKAEAEREAARLKGKVDQKADSIEG